MSGRHGNGSCCCAPGDPEKLGCIKDDHRVLFKVGPDFLSRADYIEYLVENDQWAGMLGLEEIRYEISKGDRGEHQGDLCSWFWPAVFYDPSLDTKDNGFGDSINNAFLSDPNVGFHIPKTWKAVLGDPNGVNIRVVRHLSKNTSYKRYISGAKADILSIASLKKDDDNSYVHKDEILTSGQYTPDKDLEAGGTTFYRINKDEKLERTTDSLKSEIAKKWNYLAGAGKPAWQKPGVPYSMYYAYENNIAPLNYQIQIEDFVVEWTTEIYYGVVKIFNELNCIPYRTEYKLFGNGREIGSSYFPVINRVHMVLGEQTYNGYIKSNVFEASARRMLSDYAKAGYCLTYPFFGFSSGKYMSSDSDVSGFGPRGGFTHYFHEGVGNYKSVDDLEKYTIKDGHGGGRDARDNKDEAKGDKELTWFHANPEIFNRIQITSKDFIVFNPFADPSSVGRDVTGDELSRYWITNPRNTDPDFDDIVLLADAQGIPGFLHAQTPKTKEIEAEEQKKYIRKIASVCWLQGNTWPKLKQYADQEDLQPDNRACQLPPQELKDKRIEASKNGRIFVDDIYNASFSNLSYTELGYWRWTPYFNYTDNKFQAGDSMHPQSMIAKDDKLDGAIPIQDPPQGWPGDFDNEDGTVSTFRKYTVSNPADDEEKIEYIDKVLVVGFRRERNAKEAMENPQPFFEALTAAVGDKVYHPADSDDVFEIQEIVETNAMLQPSIIRLDNQNEVAIQDVALVKDKYYYALTGRAYYLQLRYLNGDFANPFKYKVNQIDIVNGDIDVNDFGDEVAGPIDFTGSPTHIALSKNIEWKFREDTKYYNLIELNDPNEEAKIELADGPPHTLPDGFTAVSPIVFDEEKQEEFYQSGSAAPNKPAEKVFFPASLFPREDGFRMLFTSQKKIFDVGEATREIKESTEFLEDVFDTVEYKNDQKPATGYFVGSNIKLKFYLEEVEEWKKKL